MSDKPYVFLEMGEDEEDLLFTTALQDQACIGHLRGDFGRGTEFWTTWWDQHMELMGQEFQDELDELVNTMRKDGPLKDLQTMQRFCWSHPQAQMSPQAGFEYYAFRIDTACHRYYLRFFPVRGNYNFYIFCYRTDKFEQGLPQPSFSSLKKGRSSRDRLGGERS